MFDFAWSELALIGVVAVVVLGPKELPQAMRSLGKFTRQARKLASEFQGHVNDLMREAELDEVKRSVEKVSTANVGAEIDKLLDPTGDFTAELDAAVKSTEQDVKAALSDTPAVEAVSEPVPEPPQPVLRAPPTESVP